MKTNESRNNMFWALITDGLLFGLFVRCCHGSKASDSLSTVSHDSLLHRGTLALVLNMEERERESQTPDRKEGGSAPGPSSAPGPGAEPGPEPGLGAEAADDDAQKTDVCSERFDPLVALYSPAVPLPFPGIKCFNNVAEYESFLKGGRGRGKPENAEKKRRKALKGAPDPERIERLKRLMVNNPAAEPEDGAGGGGGAPRRRRQKPQKNVLTRMPLSKGSPLGELYRCVEERIRVRVYIRTFKGLRGVCSGFVVAFDKFWNLAMVDVDETYKEPVFGEEFYHEKALTVTRLFEKLKLQEEASEPPAADPENAAAAAAPESQRSDGARTEAAPEKSGERRARVKKAPRPYGRVHTRHVNQLFIRGESVILVNPQPL